jgi:hypothetical protein
MGAGGVTGDEIGELGGVLGVLNEVTKPGTPGGLSEAAAADSGWPEQEPWGKSVGMLLDCDAMVAPTEGLAGEGGQSERGRRERGIDKDEDEDQGDMANERRGMREPSGRRKKGHEKASSAASRPFYSPPATVWSVVDVAQPVLPLLPPAGRQI